MHRRELLKRGVGLGMALALAPFGAGMAQAADEKWVQTWQPADLWSNTARRRSVSARSARSATCCCRARSRTAGSTSTTRRRRATPTSMPGWSGRAQRPPQSYIDGPTVLATINMPSRASGRPASTKSLSLDEADWAQDVEHNGILIVKDRIEADDGTEWYRLQDGTVRARRIRCGCRSGFAASWQVDRRDAARPDDRDSVRGRESLYSAMAIHGVNGLETPFGTFVLQRRVANERHAGAGLLTSRTCSGRSTSPGLATRFTTTTGRRTGATRAATAAWA